ncbi:MAG: hypothetical protein J6Y29_02390 [Clostridiales bacterium]|nr:hypothetical protein [Clostridiales bacterium]
MIGIDFDELCRQGIHGDRELGIQRLLEATIAMENWYLLFEKVTDDNPKPIIGKISDKLWMFGFTDVRRAKNFLREEEMDADIIKITPSVCLPWLKKYEAFGVVGVRFNEGALGWYASIRNLEYMQRELG